VGLWRRATGGRSARAVGAAPAADRPYPAPDGHAGRAAGRGTSARDDPSTSVEPVAEAAAARAPGRTSSVPRRGGAERRAYADPRCARPAHRPPGCSGVATACPSSPACWRSRGWPPERTLPRSPRSTTPSPTWGSPHRSLCRAGKAGQRSDPPDSDRPCSSWSRPPPCGVPRPAGRPPQPPGGVVEATIAPETGLQGPPARPYKVRGHASRGGDRGSHI
jgi:hypothetical protein